MSTPSLRVLVLVPTSMEADAISAGVADQPGVMLRVCGFGCIAAAASASMLISQHRPQRVLLAGIAGALDPALPLGQAVEFERVACWGIGAGWGDAHQSATQMGWSQLPSGLSRAIDPDRLPLESVTGKTLVTVTSASASQADVQRIRTRFPDAVAEDMEGYGVALACQIAGVSLTIVRGISNLAGDRAKVNWRTNDALNATSCAVQRIVLGSEYIEENKSQNP